MHFTVRSLLSTNVGHASAVSSIAFSPKGRWLASQSYDESVIIWDVENGDQTRRFRDGRPSAAVSFSQDGDFVSASTQSGVVVWDLVSGATQSLLPIASRCAGQDVAFSLDGSYLASGAANPNESFQRLPLENPQFRNYGTLEVWDKRDLAEHSFEDFARKLRQFPTTLARDCHNRGELSRFTERVFSLEFLPNGRLVTAGEQTSYVEGSVVHRGLLSIWDLPDGKLILEKVLCDEPISRIAISPNGRLAAAICTPGNNAAPMNHRIRQPGDKSSIHLFNIDAEPSERTVKCILWWDAILVRAWGSRRAG